ncbi:MAG TPA: amidohydrolase family protein, partial [Pseudonocardiaceae bacterium]|nr:amidohydrolase family protein [Pseudonocardiaceae bacterium]
MNPTNRVDLVVRSRAAQLPAGAAPAAVAVRDGRIVAVDDHAARISAADDVDLGELALLPGLVDSHVHVNEPGRTEWEGFATATRAAAAGGITTLIDMPLNSIPPTVDVAALAAKRSAAAHRVHVDVGFWGGAIPGNGAELAGLHEAGVFGFKCFTSPSGVDEFPPLPWSQLPAVLAELARLDA